MGRLRISALLRADDLLRPKTTPINDMLFREPNIVTA
jgi:hypothetical protein